MLDNGKSQTGAAGGFAPALIHPVEALEHAGLRLFRDADAVVLYGQGAVAVPGGGRDQLDFSARAVVADGIVAQILAQFIQLIPAALHQGAFAQVGQGDEGALGIQFLALHAILDHIQQVHRFHGGLNACLAGAVQVGQLQDIIHQLDHPAGFYMDFPAKLRHIGGLGNAGLDQFCIAGNARQGRFQFVADIGREILTHLLVVFPQQAVRVDALGKGDQFPVRDILLNVFQVVRHLQDGLNQTLCQQSRNDSRCTHHQQTA